MSGDIVHVKASPAAIQAMGEKGAEALTRAMSLLPRDQAFRKRFEANAIALFRSGDYERCSVQSRLQTIYDAARLGLQLNDRTLGHCYAVPRKGVLTAQVGYKGYVELAMRSGYLRQVRAEVVYANDEFDLNLASIEPPRHRPYYLRGDDEPGRRIGAYAIWQLATGEIGWQFIPEFEIQKIKSFAEASGGAVWKSQWEDEMAKKTAILRARKMWRLDPDDAAAMDLADRLDIGERYEHEVIEYEAEMPAGRMRLGDNRGARQPVVILDDPEDDPGPAPVIAGGPGELEPETPGAEPGPSRASTPEPEPEQPEPEVESPKKATAPAKKPASKVAKSGSPAPPAIIDSEQYADAKWYQQLQSALATPEEESPDPASHAIAKLYNELLGVAESVIRKNEWAGIAVEDLAISRLAEFISLKCGMGKGRVSPFMCKHAIVPAMKAIDPDTCQITHKVG